MYVTAYFVALMNPYAQVAWAFRAFGFDSGLDFVTLDRA